MKSSYPAGPLRAADTFWDTLNSAILTAVVLFVMAIVPVLLLILLVGGFPNVFAAPLAEQWPLFKVLWVSNSVSAIRFMLQQPIWLISHTDPSASVILWSVVFYPLTVLIYFALSILIALTMPFRFGQALLQRDRLLPLAGMLLIVFVLSFVQVASCCTGGPRWVLDVGLLAMVYNPLYTAVHWQQAYMYIEKFLPWLQVLLALLGTLILARETFRAKQRSTGALKTL